MVKELIGRYEELHNRRLSEDGVGESRLVLPANFDIDILTPGMIIDSPDPMFKMGNLVSSVGGYTSGNTRELIAPLDEGHTFHAFLHRGRDDGMYGMITNVFAKGDGRAWSYRGEIMAHKYFHNGARHNWAA